MRKKQTIPEKNYLEIVFDNNDYEASEEKAIRKVETLPNIYLINDIKEKSNA